MKSLRFHSPGHVPVYNLCPPFILPLSSAMRFSRHTDSLTHVASALRLHVWLDTSKAIYEVYRRFIWIYGVFPQLLKLQWWDGWCIKKGRFLKKCRDLVQKVINEKRLKHNYPLHTVRSIQVPQEFGSMWMSGNPHSTHNISDQGLHIIIKVSTVCVTPFKFAHVKKRHLHPNPSQNILKRNLETFFCFVFSNTRGPSQFRGCRA